ncbi:AAA family ATPase [Vibrio sp. SM6]|uniref:AAA family ATPase n=1 Tax=Vibrio agarilyticus TaxID=2726741 RepID=A0A7X8YHZ7_9VIBR|nr:NERD domain-containing protein/DEAD/DEAH box helicase [Vibrio agarilyticus]NLS14095.1 AAA family ATPase [Vibrio agarilyticus]
MRLNPSQPYNNGSYAELLVFDAFRGVEMSEAICFNSLHLVSHSEKRMGELDFVLVCSRGIFVFEVKGGRVYQNKGRWYSRSSQRNHSIENPFNQSRTALFSMLNSLIEKGIKLANVPVGYGVLLPSTLRIEDSIEYDSLMLGCKSALKGFNSWLNNFIGYWVEKVYSPVTLSINEISQIANLLRPGSIFNEKEKGALTCIEHLNAMQKQVVTSFVNEQRIICEGAAGTGKTHLIKLISREFVSPEEKVLVLCESKWLKGRLKSELSASNIVIATINSLQVESRRSFTSQYDVVIIDEAQDLYQSNKINILESYIKGGFREGRWVLFQDLLNQSSFFDSPDYLVIEQLKNCCDVHLSLDIAYRYSRVTLNFLSNLLGSDRIATKKIQGPDVEIFSSSTVQDEIEQVEFAISKALKAGYRYSDITILSSNSFFDSCVSSVSESVLRNIAQLDDFNVKNMPLPEISFSQLDHFKGLENKVIVLVDFDEKCLDNTSKAYVALTRASERLLVVWASGENPIPTLYSRPEATSILDEHSESVDMTAWQEVLDLTLLFEECAALIELSAPAPICGYELVCSDAVVSEVELAWPQSKVCIFDDRAEKNTIDKFSSLGWKYYQAPLCEEELGEVSNLVSH